MSFSVDPDLIASARDGGDAMDQLLRALWPEAFRVAFGILHDRGLAEDAAQEACARIAQGITSLRAPEAFYRWMYRIVVRQAGAFASKRRDVPASSERGIDVAMPPDATAERVDLLRAVAALPVSQRTVVMLRYYAGFNSSEIAAILHVPAPTVRLRLMFARNALRAALELLDSRAVSSTEVSSHV